MAVEALFLPFGHRAYEDLAELARDGLLPAYPWQYITERQEILTRYEMAYYLKNLVARLEENSSPPPLTGRQKYILKRLIQEFSRELTALGLNMDDFQRFVPAKLAMVSGFSDGYLELDLILQANCARTLRQQTEKITFQTDLEKPQGTFGTGIVQAKAGVQIGNLSLATGYLYKNPDLSGRRGQDGSYFIEPGALRWKKEQENSMENYWHIDFRGHVSLFENTSIHAGLRWNYRQGDDHLYRFYLFNPMVNAGVSFQLSDYFRMMVDYQWYSESTRGEPVSQALLGLEWGPRALLTLKYQALSLEPALIRGELTFRF